MLIIRDMEQKDEAVILEMMQDFYNSPACLHTVPEENFRRTLTEASAGNPCVRVLILEEKERGALILLASHNSSDISLLTDLVYRIDNGTLREVKGKGEVR